MKVLVLLSCLCFLFSCSGTENTNEDTLFLSVSEIGDFVNHSSNGVWTLVYPAEVGPDDEFTIIGLPHEFGAGQSGVIRYDYDDKTLSYKVNKASSGNIVFIAKNTKGDVMFLDFELIKTDVKADIHPF